MITCPTCGAQNDDGNRFCDQCGTRVDAPNAAAAPAAAAPATAAAGAAVPACPNCGSPVTPGEAFCDNCGTALTAPSAAPVAADAAPISADAPTMLAAPSSAPAAASEPAPPAGATPPDGGVAMVACSVCGHHNLPGEAFCDNCGAALTPAAHAADTVSPNAPTVIAPAASALPPTAPDDATVVAPPVAPDDATMLAPPVAPDDATMLAPPPSADPAVAAPHLAPTEPIGAYSPPAEAAAPAVEAPPAAVAADETPTPIAAPAASTGDEAAYAAKRGELETEIARQEQIIAQFEQMQTMFGAATPPAVTQGLSEARDAVARVQAELDGLQPPAPPAPSIDPAEVARLEEEIARQQQIIGQFEQMQTMFGAATPPAVTQGLSEARDAVARVQAELAALGGGSAAAPSVAPAASVAPTPPPPAEDAAPAAAPAAQPSPGPRFVIAEGGQVLSLPTDKAEIIIGREDPVSNIFPEVDLTPFGGENGGVSRQHARMNLADGVWTITDLNSTNYTRVDGVRLDPTVPTTLKDGARVQFGRVAMSFHL